MEKKPYGTFRLGRRGRRGRIRIDRRWLVESGARSRFGESNHRFGNPKNTGLTNFLTHSESAVQSSGALPTSDNSRLEGIDEASDWDSREGEDNEDARNVSPTPEEATPEDMDADDFTILQNSEGEGSLPEGDSDNAPLLPEGFDELREYPFPADLRKLWTKLCCWQNIFAFLLLNGTGRLSVHQYDVVQAVINLFMKLGFSADAALPSSSTVKRTVQPFLQRWGFVESDVRTAAIDSTKSGAPRREGGNG